MDVSGRWMMAGGDGWKVNDPASKLVISELVTSNYSRERKKKEKRER